ncbi:MAG: UbiA family prenyltransferase [Proteobacteria bacterium]|nr:UbiA family prenyltransferase [Pseudomonadota bacterium]MBU1389932.1 UbiA family prenyltransferase [Pseudomonadota bacterium]MBU1542531.1 UbiA family prenyltransferase [Pseudomonadota bacterium]MBU2479700.1 UbiA family prenyltransferase [Pseudomonadota bacterium]
MNGKSFCLSDYIELLKPNLCAFISLSAVFGQVMADQKIGPDSFGLGVIVFILACGSAVLNNIQDQDYDRHFLRTCNRSLPRKKLPLYHAVCLCVLMTGAGLSGLAFFYGPSAFFFGCLAVVCYNGLYTPLKKYSLLAIIPGSLTGMLPPLIGWASMGKSWMAKEILLIMGIFGLWQIPHFFIVLLKRRKHLNSAQNKKSFPCFTQVFSNTQIKLQVLIWTSLYSLAILLFLLSGPISNTLLSVATGLNSMGILSVLAIMMFRQKKTNAVSAFVAINLSMLFFMAAGIGDKVFL